MAAEKTWQTIPNTLLFPHLFRTFRIAIQPTKLILAFMAVAIICIAGRLMDLTRTVVTSPGPQGLKTELQVYVQNSQQIKAFIESNKTKGPRQGVFVTLWDFASARFHKLVGAFLVLSIPEAVGAIGDMLRAVAWAVQYHLIYIVIFSVIKLTAVSVAGGAICRIAALQLARAEKPGLTEALRYSFGRFFSFFTAPLAPLAIIVVAGIFICLLGLVGNIPRIGEIIVAVLLLLAMTAGSLIAVVAIGAGAGFNLMFPAVAYDGSDCFDAISRAFNYVYTRPWRMGFYTLVAAVYGTGCYLFVRFFAFLLLLSTWYFLNIGIFTKSTDGGTSKIIAIWPVPQFVNLLGSGFGNSLNWSESAAAFIIYLFVLLIVGLLAAFVVSFFFSANTIIYALMRNRVDNTPIEDIYTQLSSGQPSASYPGASEQPSQASTEQ